MKNRRAPRPAMRLPATLDDAEAKQYAREWLTAVRSGAPGNPFDSAVMHKAQQLLLKRAAAESEPNCALVVRAAIAETEDAHEALVLLFNERLVRGEPLGPALGTYYNMHPLAPRVRPPEGRQRNFLADYAIMLLITELKAQFPDLEFDRNPASKRPSVFSIVAEALSDEGLGRGSEEAIRKIWERRGPRAIPAFLRQGPKPCVVRFTFR
jgi:hypothetical protein